MEMQQEQQEGARQVRQMRQMHQDRVRVALGIGVIAAKAETNVYGVTSVC